MAIAVGNVFEIVVRGKARGQDIVNILDYQIQSVTGDPDVISLLTDATTGFIEGWRAEILPLIHDSYRVVEYQIQQVVRTFQVLAKPRVEYDQLFLEAGDATLDKGQDTGESLPTLNAMSVQKKATGLSPRLKGGLRLGPIALNKVRADPLANYFTSAFVDSVQDAVDDALFTILADDGAGNAAAGALCIISQWLNNSPRVAEPPFVQTVTLLVAHDAVSTQRSRKPRGEADQL